MSATATTTLSDPLVVGRQPQQSVRVPSLSSPFSHHPILPTSPALPRLLPSPCDPKVEWSRSPIHIRGPPRWGSVFTAHTAKQTHASSSDPGHHHHPWSAASFHWEGTTLPRGLGLPVVRRDPASHVEGIIDSSTRRPKCQLACRQRGGRGKHVALTNEAYPSSLLPPTLLLFFRFSLIGPFDRPFSNSHTDRDDFGMARITTMFTAIRHLNLTLLTITQITQTIIIPITVTPLPTPIRTLIHI